MATVASVPIPITTILYIGFYYTSIQSAVCVCVLLSVIVYVVIVVLRWRGVYAWSFYYDNGQLTH
jgi:hypothetical protein